MNIYIPLHISENMIKNFTPTRLYVKRHTITGLRYFGKSSNKDIENYKGSGKRWQNHLKNHGKHYVVTDWVSDWFTNPHDLQDFALLISEDLDIVNSPNWANLKPEYGVEGHRPIGKLNGMYGSSRTGIDNPFFGKQHTAETKLAMRQEKLGTKMPESHKQATRNRMINTNPMDNPESVQKIKDKMLLTCCVLCRSEKKGEQNLQQHYDGKKCNKLRKKKGL